MLLSKMAVGNVSREIMRFAPEQQIKQYHSQVRYQILPLSLLILALVTTAGMAFFRSDFWLLGASFIAGGFLVVSTLLYLASKRMPILPSGANRIANPRHLSTGTLSTAAGAAAMLAMTGELGSQIGAYKVFVAQIGFALVVMGGFWLVLTLRDMI